jgi:hypothetical protein
MRLETSPWLAAYSSRDPGTLVRPGTSTFGMPGAASS